MSTSRTRRIAFWATTTLVSVSGLFAGLAYLAQPDSMMEAFYGLGYPAYFATVLGIWKILGSGALMLRPRGRWTEWAYAGFFFVFSGAAVSHVAAGDPISAAVAPLVSLGLLLTSYGLQPARTGAASAVAGHTAHPVAA